MEEILYEKAVFAPKGGKPGYIVNGKWYPVDPQDVKSKAFQQELQRYGSLRGKEQIKKDTASLAPKPKQTKPEAPKTTPPATTPAATTPAAPKTPAPKPSTSAPAPKAPTPAPAPKSSPVSDYMKAASAARKSGDPAEMAKVRDMGMEIWRKSNPKLAAAAAERQRIRGTAQTDNPLMKDMRSSLPVTPTVQAPAVKNLGSGQQSLTQNKFAGQSPTKKDIKKESYNIVIDYLIDTGHADTISEATYVVRQMDFEDIQFIINNI